jgi:thiamine biosynthesis lipoprotein
MTARGKLWLSAFFLGFAVGVLVFYLQRADDNHDVTGKPADRPSYEIRPFQEADISGSSLKAFTQVACLMGTEVRIKAHALDRAHTERVFRDAFDRIRAVELVMNVHSPGTPISVINKSGKARAHVVPEEFGIVVSRSLVLCRETDGALDITVKPVLDVYRSSEALNRAPSRDEIASALSHVGFAKVSVSEDCRTLTLADDGMALDLGATAKGYAADKATEILLQNGIEHALVEAGGDIRFAGSRSDGAPWRIGIRDPREEEGVPMAVLELAQGSVCTSGNYEQRLRMGGRTVSHIVDPRTGEPCDEIPSVTVIAPDGLTADGLATALSVLGEQGLEIVERMEGVEALVIIDTHEGLVRHASSGFDRFLAR